MKLLLTPSSPYGRAIRIAMMLKGLDEQCEMTWVAPPLDTDELIQANPHARVPTLILDNGVCLTETLLILQYLERRAPDVTLLPNRLYLSELALAGLGVGLMDAAFWIVFNRKHGGSTADQGNPLEKRRVDAITRTLERLKEAPPHPIKYHPGLGQILLYVALDYIQFRLPEYKPFESSGCLEWRKPLMRMEAVTLTEFH